MPVSAENRRLVFVFDQSKLAIHATPKAAFTSVKAACMKAKGVSGTSMPYRRTWEQVPTGYRCVFPVRHPVDRIVSAWVNGVYSRPRRFSDGLREAGVRPGMAFGDFVAILGRTSPDDHHVAPLVALLYRCPAPPYLLRFERLDDDWYTLSEYYPFLPSLPHLNASNHCVAAEAKKDTKSIALLREIYARDLEEFGYA